MGALGPILVQPAVLFGFIGFLFIWAIVSGIFAHRGVTRLKRALRQARDCLNSIVDAVAFAASYETTTRSLIEIDFIGPRWRDFRTTLLIPDGPNRIVRASEPAEHWFSQGALTDAAVNQRYHNALPGLLVGAGLLFTFLGLAAALGSAGGIVAEGISQAERNNALKTLLDTASFKFLTSLAGLFLSIAYTIFWKTRCQHQIGRALDVFIILLEERIPLRTATAAQDETIGLLQRQLTQMETFSNDLAISIGSALDGALDQRLGDHIGPLVRAVEQLRDSLATQNQDAVAGMLDEFLKKLDSNSGDGIRQAADSLATLGKDLGGLKDTLNLASQKMTEAADRMSERMGQGAEQALSRITAQFETMIESLRSLSEASRRAGADALTQLGDRIGAAAAGFESSAKRVADALAQSATDTGSALGKGAEEAVGRIAAATEGMRTELQSMLVEFRATLGAAGTALRDGGSEGAAALTGSLGTAGQDLAQAVARAAGLLESAGQSASTALQHGGESAGNRLDQAAGEIGLRATTLAGELATLAASLTALPNRIVELEQAAGKATPGFTAGAADLRAAAEAMGGAVQPLREISQTIAATVGQVGAASQRLEAVHAGSQNLAQAMTGAAQRFEGVDRELAQVLQRLQDGLQGFAQQVSKLVSETNRDMAKAATQLQSSITQLEEALEDHRPRPVQGRRV
jgi:methyl-accepting chemotaxis protein